MDFKSKSLTTFATMLMLALTLSSPVLLSTTNAAEPLQFNTYVFINAVPNPVGVGQEVLFFIGIETALTSEEVGWENMSITIERPDGKVETIANIRTDSTGTTGKVYVPTMAGTYKCQSHFPEQKVLYGGSMVPPVGTIMKASDSPVYNLTVQQDPIAYYPAFPEPTEYWTRPINAMQREWDPIAGSWVYATFPPNRYATGNAEAPETAHILWTKETQMGGLVGDPINYTAGEFGAAYENKFTNAVVIGGTLYYNPREERYPTKTVVAVDLRTGEERWSRQLTSPDGKTHRLAFGQEFYWDSYNYDGVFYFLWVTDGTTWHAFDATTGDWVYTMTNVPSGVEERGSKGEIYRYTVDTVKGRMTLWNSSRVVAHGGSFRPHGLTYNCSKVGYEWNVTIPKGVLAGQALFAKAGDRIVGHNATDYARQIVGVTYLWALDLSPERRGALLFNEPTDIAAISGEPAHTLRVSETWADWETRTFLQWSRTMHQWYAFSMDTGKYIWQTPATSTTYPLDIYGTNSAIHNGKLYLLHYGGYLYCYSMKDGSVQWIKPIDDPYAENKFSNNWGTAYVGLFLADGKVYTVHHEHSPNNPLDRGSPFAAWDAETGEEVFRMNSAFTGYSGTSFLIGDSIVLFQNIYDMQVYAVGKGPSAITVTAPDVSTELGKSVLIKGSVTDISPGTNAANRLLRFPNGVPAVSDSNMSAWMQYVYQQFPRPTDITGVEVVVNVLDSNNNTYEVGRTIADDDGFFSVEFQPPVAGKYTVTAVFEGSKSYWPSHAKTSLVVSEASTTKPASTPPMTASTADLYLLPGIAGIIVAIAVVGALVLLALRRKP